MANKEFKYEIIEHVPYLGSPDNKGWGKEVNIMTFGNSKKPIIDIRKWNRESDTMGKGVSLKLNEFKQLQKVNTNNLERYFEEETEE